MGGNDVGCMTCEVEITLSTPGSWMTRESDASANESVATALRYTPSNSSAVQSNTAFGHLSVSRIHSLRALTFEFSCREHYSHLFITVRVTSTASTGEKITKFVRLKVSADRAANLERLQAPSAAFHEGKGA